VTSSKDAFPPKVRAAIDAAQDKQAADVVVLDLEGLGAFTDYFILCTAFSARQVDAVCEEVETRLDRIGVRLLHREGKSGSDWMLLDFGSIIVHVFTERARHFYDLERLWRAARRVEFGTQLNEAARSNEPAEAEG
jgi:ribosome-associated protein